MNDLANHLWQSTFFAIGAALATTVLRGNSARFRYWLWLAASVKFLVPFSALVSLGGGLTRPRVMLPADTSTLHALTALRASTYFAPAATFQAATPLAGGSHWPELLAAIWLAGSLLLLARWCRRWYRIHNAARGARLLPMHELLPVLSSTAIIEPGVFGLLRPVLLLPDGIADNLTPGQFDAVLAHERCHVRYRDNLTAALHMCVETIFWFHPLVWWIGAKMIEERERDCDEAALKRGTQPDDYAQTIVNLCRSYIQSPLPCVAGITGASLKKRIREIMMWRGTVRVSLLRKATLTAAGLVAVTVPLVIGVMRAQTLPPPPAYSYDVVSIHASNSGQQGFHIGPGPQGGMSATNASVMALLTFAYDAHDFQFVGGPAWVSSDRFDVSFTPGKPDIAPGPGAAIKEREAFANRSRQRTQAVLRDRFGLVLRAEMRELPIYALLQAKGGHKLSTIAAGERGPDLGGGRGRLTATGVPMKMLADQLGNELDHPVVDETGLDGQYDFKLEWTPDSSLQAPTNESGGTAGGPSVFTALTEQLGLRLESKKGPVQVYVIEKIEKPSEN